MPIRDFGTIHKKHLGKPISGLHEDYCIVCKKVRLFEAEKCLSCFKKQALCSGPCKCIRTIFKWIRVENPRGNYYAGLCYECATFHVKFSKDGKTVQAPWQSPIHRQFTGSQCPKCGSMSTYYDDDNNFLRCWNCDYIDFPLPFQVHPQGISERQVRKSVQRYQTKEGYGIPKKGHAFYPNIFPDVDSKKVGKIVIKEKGKKERVIKDD